LYLDVFVRSFDDSNVCNIYAIHNSLIIPNHVHSHCAFLQAVFHGSVLINDYDIMVLDNSRKTRNKSLIDNQQTITVVR
jgi:hypothetical protein